MIDLNPYVEEYASGENDWRGHSNGKSHVGFVVRVLHKIFVCILRNNFLYASCAQFHFRNQIKLFHLDGFACFLKLANHNDVASDVDQTDVGFFKMGSNFFSVGGVRLENMSKSRRLCRSDQTLFNTYQAD